MILLQYARRDEAQPQLERGAEFSDDSLCILSHAVAGELVLHVVEDVADGVHVSQSFSFSVDSEKRAV